MVPVAGDSDVTGDEAQVSSSEEEMVFCGPYSPRDLCLNAAIQRLHGGVFVLFHFD